MFVRTKVRLRVAPTVFVMAVAVAAFTLMERPVPGRNAVATTFTETLRV